MSITLKNGDIVPDIPAEFASLEGVYISILSNMDFASMSIIPGQYTLVIADNIMAYVPETLSPMGVGVILSTSSNTLVLRYNIGSEASDWFVDNSGIPATLDGGVHWSNHDVLTATSLDEYSNPIVGTEVYFPNSLAEPEPDIPAGVGMLAVTREWLESMAHHTQRLADTSEQYTPEEMEAFYAELTIPEDTGGGGGFIPDGGGSGNYQAKTVTPSDEQQVVTPDDGYDALSKVTVEAIDIPYASDSDAQFGSLGGGLIVDDWSTGSVQNSSSSCLGYAFSVKSPCTLTEYQVYASNTRGVTVCVWDDATQGKLAEAKHTTAAAYTWETGTFEEPVNLSPGQVYVLSFEPTVSGQSSVRRQTFSNPSPEVAFNDSIIFVGTRWNSRGEFPSMDNGNSVAMVNATFSMTASEGRPASLRLHSGELDALTEEVKRITGITGTMTFSDTLAALKTVPAMT